MCQQEDGFQWGGADPETARLIVYLLFWINYCFHWRIAPIIGMFGPYIIVRIQHTWGLRKWARKAAVFLSRAENVDVQKGYEGNHGQDEEDCVVDLGSWQSEPGERNNVAFGRFFDASVRSFVFSTDHVIPNHVAMVHDLLLGYSSLSFTSQKVSHGSVSRKATCTVRPICAVPFNKRDSGRPNWLSRPGLRLDTCPVPLRALT